MTISNNEKEILIGKAKFLIDKEYKLKVDNYCISLSNGVNRIEICFPPMSDMSEVGIRFIKENVDFVIGWIAVVRDNLFVDHMDKLNSALQLLQYIEDNYEKLIDFDYCLESRKLISEYIKNKKNG